MIVKELIQKLLDCPLDSRVVGYHHDTATWDITEITTERGVEEEVVTFLELK